MTKKLTQYRIANDLSLAALGAKFKINASTLMRWEKGKIPAERVAMVSKLTSIPKDQLRPDLFGGEK